VVGVAGGGVGEVRGRREAVVGEAGGDIHDIARRRSSS
jgi:hypothetical protein